MKKRIGVVTATRAEYGLLRNVINNICISDELELVLFVTGTHLLKEYGYTVKEIENDGFPISEKIDILMHSDSPVGIAKTMGMASILFGEAFERQHLDMVIVLGDRYELLPICQAAMCARIPIAHISGGEITEGLIDEAVRHCVTKMSYLHFPSCEEYRRRIIQLGENPKRVFNYGDVGVENIKSIELMDKTELEESIGTSLKKDYFCVTFHPVTLEDMTAEHQVMELFSAIEKCPEYDFVITKSNADSGGRIINDLIDKFSDTHDNCKVFESLGLVRYLSLMKNSKGVIGNSSSGIIEAPILCVPTINIGDRQRGRLKAESIIDCEPCTDEILNAIQLTFDEVFIKDKCKGTSPYNGDSTAKKIVETILEFLQKDEIDLKKRFYDLQFNSGIEVD